MEWYWWAAIVAAIAYLIYTLYGKEE